MRTEAPWKKAAWGPESWDRAATPELHLLIYVGVQEIFFGLNQLQLSFCLLETQSQSSLSKSEAKLGLNQVSAYCVSLS